jgi:hypothetical protein
MVDVQDEDDVVFLSPAEAVRPVTRKKQQQLDIIDLSSPTQADGEAKYRPSSVPRTAKQQFGSFRAARA